jgi:ribosome-associated protein
VEEFKLEGTEFIELNNLLKIKGLCPSGGMAKAVIAEGLVTVDGNVELRKRRKIRAGQVVQFDGHAIIVQAGGPGQRQ